jgi:hypothetical protein
MSRCPKAVIYTRPDLWCAICSWCTDKKEADAWAEENGYEATHGICPKCIKKFKADSLRGSNHEIKKYPSFSFINKEII